MPLRGAVKRSVVVEKAPPILKSVAVKSTICSVFTGIVSPLVEVAIKAVLGESCQVALPKGSEVKTFPKPSPLPVN